MKARSIIFNSEMVRAILKNRKTQTRRAIPQRVLFGDGINFPTDKWLIEHCPFGQPGDRLWVKETFWLEGDTDGDEYKSFYVHGSPSECEGFCKIAYCATDKEPKEWHNGYSTGEAYKKHPSIHMPRWASRITLEIINIRVERLQEISEEEAEAEGALLMGCNDERGDERNYIEGFQEIWNSHYSKTFPWSSNPWVWVIEFRRIDEQR